MASGAGSSRDESFPAELRKKLFKSPVVEGDRLLESSDNLTLMNQLQIQHSLEMARKAVEKEQLEKRLKQLRLKLTAMSEDNWRYQPVEKLIGQH
ncbi:hypothetical protein FSP39_016818 [Pinctada imbricata]|uniref:Uncharacterized protein n=1 Tax=Pinctada imbricata TaxID=66713 RepID=A0AA89BR75_PINIB|nr:hypothetical protein FSP39_016818 [Pinctada imbricata]